VGGSQSAKRLADWMNTVSDLFNFANIPSGGTVEATERGLQIEVDSSSEPYHFEVIKDTNTTVKVRGGWWAYYTDEVRAQVDLDDGVSSTITSFDDLTAAITVGASGFVYLELDLTSAATLTAKFAATIPADATDIYRKKIATVTWDTDHISEIEQDWRGGNLDALNILGSGELPRWDEILDANTDVDMFSDTDSTGPTSGDILKIGDDDNKWKSIFGRASRIIELDSGLELSEISFTGARLQLRPDLTHTATLWAKSGSVRIHASAGDVVLQVNSGYYIDISPSSGGYIRMANLPTSDPSDSGVLFTRTASQLGGSGSEKVICIS